MKKFVSLLLTFAVLFAFSACENTPQTSSVGESSASGMSGEFVPGSGRLIHKIQDLSTENYESVTIEWDIPEDVYQDTSVLNSVTGRYFGYGYWKFYLAFVAIPKDSRFSEGLTSLGMSEEAEPVGAAEPFALGEWKGTRETYRFDTDRSVIYRIEHPRLDFYAVWYLNGRMLSSEDAETYKPLFENIIASLKIHEKDSYSFYDFVDEEIWAEKYAVYPRENYMIRAEIPQNMAVFTDNFDDASEAYGITLRMESRRNAASETEKMTNDSRFAAEIHKVDGKDVPVYYGPREKVFSFYVKGGPRFSKEYGTYSAFLEVGREDAVLCVQMPVEDSEEFLKVLESIRAYRMVSAEE